MKNTLLYTQILPLLFLLACGGETKKGKEDVKKENTGSESENVSTYVMPQLNNQNVKDELLAYGKENKESSLIISTSLGDIKVKLYDDVPMHRSNFVYLSKRKFFDGTLFYRIVPKFMIQAGSFNFPQKEPARKKIGEYKIPPEIMISKYIHKKGALAMAKKQGENVSDGSAPYDFFIVVGEKLTPGQVKAYAAQNKISYTPEQIQLYGTLGGVPGLDGLHTVFGEVVEGMEVVDKIAALKTRKEDGWPIEGGTNLRIKVLDE